MLSRMTWKSNLGRDGNFCQEPQEFEDHRDEHPEVQESNEYQSDDFVGVHDHLLGLDPLSSVGLVKIVLNQTNNCGLMLSVTMQSDQDFLPQNRARNVGWDEDEGATSVLLAGPTDGEHLGKSHRWKSEHWPHRQLPAEAAIYYLQKTFRHLQNLWSKDDSFRKR